MRKKTCLVTGGSGFIGSFIIEELIRRGYIVINFDRIVNPVSKRHIIFVEGDLRDIAKLHKCLKSVDEVYHCAGVLGTEELFDNPQEAVDINLIGLVNLLEAAVKSNIQKFFYPSSPYIWRNTYSLTKHAGEELCLVYNRAYGLNTRILRLWNIYGPKQTFFPIRKVVPVFILQALLNEPIEIYGNGQSKIRLIYVVDLAKIIVDFMAHEEFYKQPLDIDIGMQSIITVKELARMIISLCNSQSSIVYLPKRFGEFDRLTPRRLMNVLQVLSGKYTFTSVEQGLSNTIAHYKRLPYRTMRNTLLRYRRSELYQTRSISNEESKFKVAVARQVI